MTRDQLIQKLLQVKKLRQEIEVLEGQLHEELNRETDTSGHDRGTDTVPIRWPPPLTLDDM